MIGRCNTSHKHYIVVNQLICQPRITSNEEDMITIVLHELPHTEQGDDFQLFFNSHSQ